MIGKVGFEDLTQMRIMGTAKSGGQVAGDASVSHI
jgi:hypothetical protein